MKRFLMFLYLVLVTSEAKPKIGWRRRIRRRVPDSLLTFAESGVFNLPKPPRRLPKEVEKKTEREPALDLTPVTPSEPQHRKDVEVIPQRLVDREAEVAIALQMPSTPRPTAVVMGLGRDGSNYDTPIGRTLTREFIQRDPRHAPLVAIRHVPVDDAIRTAWHASVTTPHPSSPRRRGTDKKGRPTPKRPRRNHGH